MIIPKSKYVHLRFTYFWVFCFVLFLFSFFFYTYFPYKSAHTHYSYIVQHIFISLFRLWQNLSNCKSHKKHGPFHNSIFVAILRKNVQVLTISVTHMMLILLEFITDIFKFIIIYNKVLSSFYRRLGNKKKKKKKKEKWNKLEMSKNTE